MSKIKFMGKENIIRLVLTKDDAGVPIISKEIIETKDILIGEYELDTIPNEGELISLDENTEFEVLKVKRFLNGGVTIYTDCDFKETINKSEKELIDKYHKIEMKRFIENLKNTNPDFVSFLELLGESNDENNEDLLKKYKAFNGMLKARDGFFR